jgi:hypothetical protein
MPHQTARGNAANEDRPTVTVSAANARAPLFADKANPRTCCTRRNRRNALRRSAVVSRLGCDASHALASAESARLAFGAGPQRADLAPVPFIEHTTTAQHVLRCR